MRAMPIMAMPIMLPVPLVIMLGGARPVASDPEIPGRREVRCSVVEVCCEGIGEAVPARAHLDDSSYALSDHARRSQACRLRPAALRTRDTSFPGDARAQSCAMGHRA